MVIVIDRDWLAVLVDIEADFDASLEPESGPPWGGAAAPSGRSRRR